MIKKTLLLICLMICFIASSFTQDKEFPKLIGPYLGQKPPGTTPEVFAPGIVSTDSHEFSCCFSPDGKEFYFSRRRPQINETVIMMCKLVDGIWTEPYIAPFVEKQLSFEPWVTPDNKRLYFQSGKPVRGQAGPSMNILYVEREGDGWGEAKNPGSPFNPSKTMHVSSTMDGTIYTTDISGGPGSESLAIIKKVDGEYLRLEKLGFPLNKEKLSMHPWISPDDSYMIFGTRRPTEKIKGFLYFSFKKEDGNWSEPIVIDLGINAGAGLPFITQDGKYLFFTSGEPKSDIYWVSSEIIEGLKQKTDK